MSVGNTYKFFGYSTAYTVLKILLPSLYYQLVLSNPCTFSLILPFPLPNRDHINDSACLLICFLDSIVDSDEFITILMFIVLIFLNKSR